jgi:phosphoenolpyruvate-protein phosphotransferase
VQQRTVQTGVALHARPLDRLVRATRRFSCRITLDYGGRQADGKNVVQLLLLAVPRGAEVTLTAEGEDEGEALDALVAVLSEEPGADSKDAAGDAVTGVPGAPGIGVGVALRERSSAPRPATPGSRPVEEERLRLTGALEAATQATQALLADDDPFCDIFRAQQTMLEDLSLLESLRQGVADGASTEDAVTSVFSALERRFDSMGSSFAAERHADVADVRDRILGALGAGEGAPLPQDLGQQVVLILGEATPSRMATLDRERVAAVVSGRGGPTSHAAIVARGRGIPLVFAASRLTDGLDDGQLLLVDGRTGIIQPVDQGLPLPKTQSDDGAPSPPTTSGRTASTSDGRPVVIRANLGAPGELAEARRAGAAGCGLLRTELLFGGRQRPPSVEEQAEVYARVARALAPHPVVVRLFDAGSDKPLPFLPPSGEEPNPALGVRGVRLLLRHPQVLADQLKAIHRARTRSDGDLRVLVPMVVDAEEVEQVRAMAAPDLPLGAMIETPAAALLVQSIARQVSFVSIGSNDLEQYLLAMDRSLSPLTSAPCTMHPALLRVVADVARGAALAGVDCSVCGELAGNPAVVPLLLGIGVETLSVAPPRVARLREVIGLRSTRQLENLARRALEIDDAKALERLITEVREEHDKEHDG